MLVDLSFNQLLQYVCKLIYSKQSIFRYIAGQNCKDLTFVKAKRYGVDVFWNGVSIT
jgi:hypothetical protein